MKYLGIDFGTVWTKAVIYDSQTKKNIPVNMEDGSNDRSDYELFGGKDACPTAVFFDKENRSRLVGKEATRNRNRDPLNFHDRFKPELDGKNAEKWMPYVADVLKYVYDKALDTAGANSFDKVVLTVPSSTGKEGRRWNVMLKASEMAKIPNIEIIKEPEAASYYILSELIASKNYNNGDKFLVYDFGGGTFDPALVEIWNGTLRVIGEWEVVRGKNIGGIYIDEKIKNDMVEQVTFFQEEVYDFLNNIPKDDYGRQILKIEDKIWMRDYRNAMLYRDKLMQIPVEAKHHLSKESITKYIKSELGIYDYSLDIEHFNEMIESLIDDTILCCDDLLNTYRDKDGSSYKWKDLSKVFLVGGSSLIPLVHKKLKTKRIVEEAKFDICLQKVGNQKIDILHAVAIGASMYEALQPSRAQRLQFGKFSLENHDYDEAEHHFKKGEHYFWLGMMEYEGLGRTGYKKALEWFSKAKSPQSIFMLALMNFRGQGVRKNDEVAKDLLGSLLKNLKLTILLEIAKAQTLIKVINGTATTEEINEVYSDNFHKLNNYSI